MGLLAPTAILGGLLYLLSREDKVSEQPTFDAKAVGEITFVKDGVRWFKPHVAAMILAGLKEKGLELVRIEDGEMPKGIVLFKVVALSEGALAADEAIAQAHAEHVTVLGSLSLALPGQAGDKLLSLTTDKGHVNVKSAFAVLVDAAGAPGTVALGGPAPPFDPGMSPELVQEVNAYLADPKASPEALEKAAAELEVAGYPLAAKSLRDRAAILRLKASRLPGRPFLIRTGPGKIALDLPYYLAKHYTGDGNRWREIASANAHLSMIVKHNGLDPWSAGLEVYLPHAWETEKKPIPAPLTVPKKSVSGENGIETETEVGETETEVSEDA